LRRRGEEEREEERDVALFSSLICTTRIRVKEKSVALNDIYI
jgi:hypothetical protein